MAAPDWAILAALDARNKANDDKPIDPATATREEYLREVAVDALVSIAMSLRDIASRGA